MEQITLGDIAVAVTFIVGLLTSAGYLRKHFKDWLEQTFTSQFDELKTQINGLSDRIDEVDMEACKNYLVIFLSDIERGGQIDEIEKERFWEQYERYIRAGGNSYIKRKVENLVKEGRL